MNKNKTAKIISYLFIPPVMNVIIFLLFAFTIERTDKRLVVILSSLLFGFVLPLATFIILRKKGRVIDNDATVKEERTVPYLFGIAFSIVATIFLYYSGANIHSVSLWLSYLVNSLVLITINKFWKISAHAMGAAIPLGASILSLNNKWIVIFSIILILVAWSRYKLKVHTIPQIIAGAIVGIFITYILLNFV